MVYAQNIRATSKFVWYSLLKPPANNGRASRPVTRLVEEQYDFECNLVLISTSRFFKDNKIARARRTRVALVLHEICTRVI